MLGEDAWTLSAEAKMRIGYVPQVITLYPWMKVRHIIEYTSAFYPNWNYDLSGRLVAEWSLPPEDRIRHALGRPAPDGWPSCWRWATSRSC